MTRKSQHWQSSAEGDAVWNLRRARRDGVDLCATSHTSVSKPRDARRLEGKGLDAEDVARTCFELRTGSWGWTRLRRESSRWQSCSSPPRCWSGCCAGRTWSCRLGCSPSCRPSAGCWSLLPSSEWSPIHPQLHATNTHTQVSDVTMTQTQQQPPRHKHRHQLQCWHIEYSLHCAG